MNIIQEMFDTIILIQPKGSSGGVEVTREEKIRDMASELLYKLPDVFNMFDVKERYKYYKNVTYVIKTLF